MGTTTKLVLDQKLLEATGDWLQVTATTAIAASKLFVSTELNNYDHAQDGTFDHRRIYIEDFANAGVERLLGSTTYATSTGTAYVFGANLLTDSANKATVRISRSSYTDRDDAIKRAIGELYSNLYKSIDDLTLILGSSLPNAHFETQTTSGTPDKWAFSNATGAKETTDTWGGVNAVKVTASAANGYLTLKSDNWRRLIPAIQGRTISVYVAALPEVADDADITIYTKQADGTEQTLISTTSCPAGEFTILQLEDQSINDNLREAEIRLRVNTDTKYVIFDDCYISGTNPMNDYLLSSDLQSGGIDLVEYQVTGNPPASTNNMCDDFSPDNTYERVFGWNIRDDGTDRFLRLPDTYRGLSKRRLRITGTQPYETLSSATDTIATNDVGEVDLIISYAAYLLYEKEAGPISADDTEKYNREMARFDYKTKRLLLKHIKPIRSGTININPL
ncbi:hypothetical protein LCGC14_0396850 [marine sediment metagenome]|uniref:Uncharacterized protein n=1 Tax=marine sediment metagenome TaxID=412755 RepID=A0A0F9W785_9ZZZZ